VFGVAQTSKSAVPQVSKPAGGGEVEAGLEAGDTAGLETCDTAGLETCGTQPRLVRAKHIQSPSGGDRDQVDGAIQRRQDGREAPPPRPGPIPAALFGMTILTL